MDFNQAAILASASKNPNRLQLHVLHVKEDRYSKWHSEYFKQESLNF